MTPVGELLCGRYRLERLLGQGGMADVFRAVDTTSEEPVAIKLVRSADPGLARRLAQEAKALARLDHPGLVRLLDADVHGDQAFLVMELVEGQTLAARLRRGPLSPARTAMLGRTLSGALAYVHDQGIVHRDVKPGNVLLGPGPRVRLADFGIARLADASSLTMTGTTLGTASYMAPEQLEHHAVGAPADVWSLGVILLESLTGHRVFEGTATEVVARRLAGPVPLPADLPTPWRLLFEGMLEHDPSRRPTAEQAAGLLSAAPYDEPWQRAAPDQLATMAIPVEPGNGARNLSGARPAGGAGAEATAAVSRGGGSTLVAPHPTPTPPPAGARRRRGLLWAALAVVVLAAAGVSAWALSSGTATLPAAHHGSATTTTSTPTTSTTTTTPPTTSSASAALVRDVEAGVASGAIRAKTSRTLLDQLNQALAQASGGHPDEAASTLGAMDGTIANEVQSGDMTPAEASTLVGDVAALATAIGVSNPATTTTTAAGAAGTSSTTSPSTSTTAGNANGNGNGNGH
jgi:hypothetical protein